MREVFFFQTIIRIRIKKTRAKPDITPNKKEKFLSTKGNLRKPAVQAIIALRNIQIMRFLFSFMPKS